MARGNYAKGGAGRSGLSVPSEQWDGKSRLRLGLGWSLSDDGLQWVVSTARNHKGAVKWQPVAFVRSNSDVLRRVLREAGAELSPDGERALNALPATYRQWREALDV